MAGELIITHGLPGSGKSTWAEGLVRSDPANTIRVNRDDIRTALFGESYHTGSFPAKDEAKVTEIEKHLLESNLKAGKRVISDNTNLNKRTIRSLAILAQKHGASIKQEYFDVSIDEAKRRNAKRASEGGRNVPEFVYDSMSKNSYTNGKMNRFIIKKDNEVLSVPTSSEFIDKIDDFNKELANDNPIKGKAVVILDMDGTLFNNALDSVKYIDSRKNKDRDFDSFYENIRHAPVNEGVRDLVNKMRDNDQLNIIAVTGRSDRSIDALMEGLKRSGVKISELHMKNDADNRSSSEFKMDVLDSLEKRRLVPVHAIDDRKTDIQAFTDRGVQVTVVDKPKIDFANIPENYSDVPEPSFNTSYGSGTCIRCGSKLKNPNSNIGDTCRRKAR